MGLSHMSLPLHVSFPSKLSLNPFLHFLLHEPRPYFLPTCLPSYQLTYLPSLLTSYLTSVLHSSKPFLYSLNHCMRHPCRWLSTNPRGYQAATSGTCASNTYWCNNRFKPGGVMLSSMCLRQDITVLRTNPRGFCVANIITSTVQARYLQHGNSMANGNNSSCNVSPTYCWVDTIATHKVGTMSRNLWPAWG